MQDKRHIVIILYFNSPMGGLHLNVLDSVEFLLKQNIEITVIAKPGVFLERVNKLGAKSIAVNFNLNLDYNLEQIVNKLSIKPSLIHTHPFKARELSLKISKHFSIPIIMTLHSINDGYINRYEKDIDCFVSVSDLVRDFIINQEVNPNKVFTIENGIEVRNNISTTKTNEFKTILTVSRFDKDKLFINNSIKHSLEQILENNLFNFNWQFVGSGNDRKSLEEIAAKINKKASRNVVSFLGWKDKKELEEIYIQADIFVGPGRSIIEALSFGIPSVALGSKGYVGIINEDNYLSGIYSNFGGDRGNEDETLLYKDIVTILSYTDIKLKTLQALSFEIVKTFFDISLLNQKLLHIYNLFTLVPSIAHKKNSNRIRLNKLFTLNEENYFLKGDASIDFSDNKIYLKGSSNNETIYLIAGNNNVNGMPSLDYEVKYLEKIHVYLSVKTLNIDIKIFFIEFDDTKKTVAKSYDLTDGFNGITHILSKGTKLLKVAFRIIFLSNDSYVELSKFHLKHKKIPNYLPKIQHIENSYKLYRGKFTYSIYSKCYNLLYYAHYKPKKKLLISFNGAIDRNKQIYDFQRFSWADEVDYSWLSIIDPTITEDNDLNIGWYQGSKNDFAIKSIVNILKKIFLQNGIDEKDVIFFGSSAGGFASLKMAEYFTNSSVVVINPQIYLYKYFKNMFLKMSKEVFDLDDLKLILDRYKKQLEISIDFTKREATIYYIQNEEDIHHYKEHFMVYKNSLDSSIYEVLEFYKFNSSSKKLVFLTYSDETSGHTPLGKEETLNFLDLII